MQFIVAGTSHSHSDLALRERLALVARERSAVLRSLQRNCGFSGVSILMTCNRIEFYCSAPHGHGGADALRGFLCQHYALREDEFARSFYVLAGEAALAHLTRVAAGLESLIIGETQVRGQVKAALAEAESCRTADTFLAGVFKNALEFAGKIHRETEIAKGSVSVGSVTRDFIVEKTGLLHERTVMVIGLGEVSELVLRYLVPGGAKLILVANRDYQRAQILAGDIHATAIRHNELPRYLAQADIVIAATRSPHYVLRQELIAGCLKKPMLIIDLAVPRDVDPAVRDIAGVVVYGLEELDAVISRNQFAKQQAARAAEKIIEKETAERWQGLSGLAPAAARWL